MLECFLLYKSTLYEVYYMESAEQTEKIILRDRHEEDHGNPQSPSDNCVYSGNMFGSAVDFRVITHSVCKCRLLRLRFKFLQYIRSVNPYLSLTTHTYPPLLQVRKTRSCPLLCIAVRLESDQESPDDVPLRAEPWSANYQNCLRDISMAGKKRKEKEKKKISINTVSRKLKREKVYLKWRWRWERVSQDSSGVPRGAGLQE